jgi:hypothetical protein
MGQRIDQIVARVEDPANPVVWLDPSTSDDLWAALPDALKARAFVVVILEGAWDAESLRAELVEVLGGSGTVREVLAGLGREAVQQQGWAILFRHPEELREKDEAAFEQFLEAVESIHEMHWAERRSHLKLVVTD